MAAPTNVLQELLLQIRASVDGRTELVVLEESDSSLTLRVGRNESAVLGLTVDDAARPSFVASYPKLTVKRDGRSDVRAVRVEGVVAAGVEWIVRQLAEHGVVKPEF